MCVGECEKETVRVNVCVRETVCETERVRETVREYVCLSVRKCVCECMRETVRESVCERECWGGGREEGSLRREGGRKE